MKKILLAIILMLSATIGFSEELERATYGENSISVIRAEDESLLLEIVLPKDNIIFRYWTKSRYMTHILDEFELWDTRISLGLNAGREVVVKYDVFSDAAFDFGEDVGQYIIRVREGENTVYIFEMYKSDSYEVFMATYNLF